MPMLGYISNRDLLTNIGKVRLEQSGADTRGEANADRINEFDSYDDDLSWIIERLTARVDCLYGQICRYTQDEDQPQVLAQSGVLQDALQIPFKLLERAVLDRVSFDHRRLTDTQNVTQAALIVPNANGVTHSFRYLRLVFQPAQRVIIIATICRLDGDVPFTVAQEKVATSLYAILIRYVRLWWMYRAQRRRAHALSSALDNGHVGVIVLDRNGDVLFSSKQANRLLDDEDGLRRSERSIAAEEPADGVRLQVAIRHTIHCNIHHCKPESDRTRIDKHHVAVLSLRRSEHKRDLLVLVMHVERNAIDSHDPAAIVYVLDPNQDVKHLLAPVCGIYKLTAAETRLVHQLVSGLNIAEAAEHLRIQPQTARAYLKQIFCKTNTHRQADLVRVILSSLLQIKVPSDLVVV